MAIRKREWVTKGGKARKAFVADYTTQNGDRIQKQFRRKEDAEDFLAKSRIEVRAGTHTPETKSITVTEAADIWLEAVRVGRNSRGPAENSTLRNYVGHIRNHIVPYWGRTKLAQLSAANVSAFRDHLLANNSRPMARKVLVSFKSILAEAQSPRGLIAVNVAQPIKIGAGGGRHKQEKAIPQRAEIKRLYAELDRLAGQQSERSAKAWRRWRVFIATAIESGLRMSEIRGLPWRAIDFKAGKISVTQRADERGAIGSPKSAASRRTIIVPASLIQLLREWKLESLKTDPDDLVFGTDTGRPVTLPNFRKRCWVPLMKATGMSYTPHALRHYHASALIADHATPKEIMVEMGHSTIQLVFNVYGHLFSDQDTEKAQRERANRLSLLST